MPFCSWQISVNNKIIETCSHKLLLNPCLKFVHLYWYGCTCSYMYLARYTKAAVRSLLLCTCTGTYMCAVIVVCDVMCSAVRTMCARHFAGRRPAVGRAGRARGLPAGLRHLGECLAGHGRLFEIEPAARRGKSLIGARRARHASGVEGGREGRAREFYAPVASLGSEGEVPTKSAALPRRTEAAPRRATRRMCSSGGGGRAECRGTRGGADASAG